MDELAGSFFNRHAVAHAKRSDCLQTYGFRFSFTPLPRFFSPFPHGTVRYRSFRRVLPWMVVHPASHRVPRAPWYSGSRPACRPFAYEGLALSAVPSQALPLGRASLLPVLNPGGPRAPGLGSSRFARRYWGNHFCLLFLRLLRCFSSPGCLPFGSCDMARMGLPHSETRGSMPTCGSPRLFAAYRVLRRLETPRHPPYALCSLTCSPGRPRMSFFMRGRPAFLFCLQVISMFYRCLCFLD